MSEKYPALAELGIQKPREIERYSLQTINHTDILRVIYARKKGSLLPASRKYKFGRAEKMVITDSGKHETEVVHEISPFLIKVTRELDQIVKSHDSNEERLAVIKDEIKRLEEDVHSRLAYIQSLLEACD